MEKWAAKKPKVAKKAKRGSAGRPLAQLPRCAPELLRLVAEFLPLEAWGAALTAGGALRVEVLALERAAARDPFFVIEKAEAELGAGRPLLAAARCAADSPCWEMVGLRHTRSLTRWYKLWRFCVLAELCRGAPRGTPFSAARAAVEQQAMAKVLSAASPDERAEFGFDEGDDVRAVVQDYVRSRPWTDGPAGSVGLRRSVVLTYTRDILPTIRECATFKRDMSEIMEEIPRELRKQKARLHRSARGIAEDAEILSAEQCLADEAAAFDDLLKEPMPPRVSSAAPDDIDAVMKRATDTVAVVQGAAACVQRAVDAVKGVFATVERMNLAAQA